MTNQHHEPSPPNSDKWDIDSFTIRMVHMEYIDSMENQAHKKHNEVNYDMDLHFPGDAVSTHVHTFVNG